MQLVEIEDPSDPRLGDYADVRDPVWLRRRDVFLVEGVTLVEKLLCSPRFHTRSLAVTATALERIAPALVGRGVTVFRVAAQTLAAVAGVRFHQGCVAVAEPPPDPGLGVLLSQGARRWLVLENVSDPDNVGGVFRCARAFGADGIALGPGCAHPLYRKTTRTALGATLEMPFTRVEDWPWALKLFREFGLRLLGLTPHGPAVNLGRLGRFEPLPKRFALLVGHEGHGLSEAALGHCDQRVRIAMAPDVDSLNVAMAAGIALHWLASELRRH
ncbi:MAG: TrmH family RNA methyltransferase [Myxococcota bacterium]